MVEEAGRVNAAFQEHFKTKKDVGPAKEVINLAIKRLGPGGIFTLTCTGDDRLSTDERYEAFVETINPRDYVLKEIGDRGVEIYEADRGVSIKIYNSVEYETRDIHLVAFGMPRGMTTIRTGSKMSFVDQLEEIFPYNPLVLIGHPGSKVGGLNKAIYEELENGNLDLNKIDGVAMYTGSSNIFPGSNKRSFQIARQLSILSGRQIAPYIENDSHTPREFCRVSTSIPEPSITNEDVSPEEKKEKPSSDGQKKNKGENLPENMISANSGKVYIEMPKDKRYIKIVENLLENLKAQLELEND